MSAEFLQAGLVDVLNPVVNPSLVEMELCIPQSPPPWGGRIIDSQSMNVRAGISREFRKRFNVHAPCTSRHSPPLLEALELALAGVFGFALHVVIVVVTAAGADEEGGRQERGRAGTKLLDLGDGVRERGSVVEDLLIEPVVANRMSLQTTVQGVEGRPSSRLRAKGAFKEPKYFNAYTGFRAAILTVLATQFLSELPIRRGS